METEQETIERLHADLEQQRKMTNALFSENSELQRRINRLQRVEGVLWTLMELAGDVWDRKKASEGK
jgi:hypothetical protein